MPRLLISRRDVQYNRAHKLFSFLLLLILGPVVSLSLRDHAVLVGTVHKGAMAQT